MYPEIPVLSFLSAALALVPLIWYLPARNIAAVAVGTWLSITNLIFAVNALIWAESTEIKAAVWCDVSTAMITGSHVALPTACFCICIHLERLASFCQMSAPQGKSRRFLYECLLCFGLPVVYIVLHLIVQPRRFDLFYGFGCRPVTYPTVATIFLVMIPPLLLTGATIVCAGLAWRHFLVHGVQFHGKRASVSSLTRSLYLRLVGMALSEAVFSAVLIVVLMWGVLSPGLAPMKDMSRRLNDILTWRPGTTTNSVRIALKTEWSVTVVQSVLFFGLFACRTEVMFQGLELLGSFLRLLRRPNLPGRFGRGSSEHSSESASVLTLPITVVDLSLVIQSTGTFSPHDHATDKSIPSIPGASRRPSLVADSLAEDEVVISAIDTGVVPLESPSHASAIASSHNSLESSFDPGQLVFSPDAWPRTPTTIPVRFSRRPLSMGYDTSTYPVCTADFWAKLPGYEVEKRQGIYVTVAKETLYW